MKVKRLIMPLLGLTMLTLASCGETNREIDTYFEYHPTETRTIGSKTNSEEHIYDSIKIAPVSGLRDDFAMGVDASMVNEVEKAGGVYYNNQGQEQDVFEVLRDNGVNFARLRLWNDPYRKVGNKPYGGGNNNYANDLIMAKRIKKAGLNLMIDFHYSDFWADPDHQQVPKAWQNDDYTNPNNTQIPERVKSFTKEILNKFKSEGITVDAVQIGNEINNGMIGYAIDWNNVDTSYKYMAKVIQSGIEGAKEVNKDVRTIIHLANGGNKAEFEAFFRGMEANKVDYDIIGASFYPQLSGALEDLQANLNNVSQITGKAVMVCETSWGSTLDYNEYTANQFTQEDEDVGGYLTGEQGQATAMRDIINVLAKVPNKKGLGIFYWEPGWLPVSDSVMWASNYGQAYQNTGSEMSWSDYTDGKATWSNQGLFSFTGKALASLQVFGKVREGYNAVKEKSIAARHTSLDVTLNVADNAKETLPDTLKCVTNLAAIRDFPATYSAEDIEKVKVKGSHTVTATIDGQYTAQLNVKCIENFIIDPGFEKQGESDNIVDPWKIASVTPAKDKVVKLDRKKDVRNGKTDLNWFHGSADFTFDVYQEVKNVPAGSYDLATYIMGIEPSKAKHTKLEVYVVVNGVERVVDMKDIIDGWGVPQNYHLAAINEIEITATTNIKVGIRGAGAKGAWGHNDDWSLVTHE